MRLDQLVYAKGLASSRQKAQALILAGRVLVNGKKIDKVGKDVSGESEIRIREHKEEFVSRGGTKLAHALDHFSIDVKGLIALDVGVSTGGFCDCLLQRGVKKVYAIDVGRGQIAWKLRQDPRVHLLEKTNIRYIDPRKIKDLIEFAAVDVSFISLELVLPKIISLLHPDWGEIVSLVKPQFEVGKNEVGKGGVVRDPQKHMRVLRKLSDFIIQHTEVSVKGVVSSPIRGPKGNKEFFFYLSKKEAGLPEQELIAAIDTLCL
ncbi:MAG: TlyA family RNA methyltransferase [bacterium]